MELLHTAPCAQFYTQFFTIHGFINDYYIPLVFCLLEDKTEETYTSCCNHVKQLCESWNLQIDPHLIVIDFEMAIHNAVGSVWPRATIRRCRSHLSQAWWRQIQKAELTAYYKDKNSEIGKWLGYVFGLIFLPAKEVGDCFALELMAIKPDHPKGRQIFRLFN